MVSPYQPVPAEQVPLLTAMGEDERALIKALESGDTDLAYLAVFHVWRKCQFGEFVKVIDQHPQARDLFLAYCRRTDPELLKSYQFSVGNASDAADAIAVEAWRYNVPKLLEGQPVGVADVTFQSRLLNQAGDLYSKSKDHALQVGTTPLSGSVTRPVAGPRVMRRCPFSAKDPLHLGSPGKGLHHQRSSRHTMVPPKIRKIRHFWRLLYLAAQRTSR